MFGDMRDMNHRQLLEVGNRLIGIWMSMATETNRIDGQYMLSEMEAMGIPETMRQVIFLRTAPEPSAETEDSIDECVGQIRTWWTEHQARSQSQYPSE